MIKRMMMLGAIAFLLASCDDQTVADMLQKQKKEPKTQHVTKQEEKILPEVKIYGENGVGAGIILKKEKNTLYIATNGALVASKPTALIQFSNEKLTQGEVHFISTGHNLAILKVSYKATVNVPAIYMGELDGLAVYADGDPFTIKNYTDKVTAYFVEADETLPIGSPVMEEGKGEVVGIYFNRQQQGKAEPYIMPLKSIIPLLDEWIDKGMTPKDRLAQSKNLYPYIEKGDQEAVKQAIKKFGQDIFSYHADELKLFIDLFQEHLKTAVIKNDSAIINTLTGTEELQGTLDSMVAYYVSKNAKIQFSNTEIKNIKRQGQNIIVRAKTDYVLINAAGQEALATSTTIYEINKTDEGEYKMIRLTTEE